MNRPPNTNHILHFFLDLYRRQLGLSESQRQLMSVSPLTSAGSAGEMIYELKAIKGGREKRRRMSICRLGEDVESRSTCYKVIYDDLLVLKIPPVPITDFGQYLKNIELEGNIAGRLAPEVPCVTPTLSAIMKKIPGSMDNGDLSLEAYEREMALKLRQSPDLQQCLKIQGTFVLFMSLSRDLFFDQVLKRMHKYEIRLKDEIVESSECMSDILAFENRFGRGNESLFFSFSDLQERYVYTMDQLLEQYERESYDVADYRKKQWMFDQLAGRRITGVPEDLPVSFMSDQNRIGREVLGRQKKEIAAFVNLIKTDLRKTGEERNRNVAVGIISNLLKLLFYLRTKRTAIRDMKPDNMFLAGDSEDPDYLLASADEYRLGLIDLETSANIQETGLLKQPILAGTPFFATPSHLFENEVLKKVFQDVPRTLYFQDWFAAVGMIYHVVTGETLFVRTSKLLPEVVRVRSKATMRSEPLEDVLKGVSWVFWHAASTEFKEKTESAGRVFKSISISLSREEGVMLAEETVRCVRLLKKQIEKSVLKQRFFTDEKAQRSICAARSERIDATLKKMVLQKGHPETSKNANTEAMDFLRSIAQVKRWVEKLQRWVPLLENERLDFSALDLNILLFRLVFGFMYRPEWSNRKHPDCL